jgi:hypothetical protein
MFRLRESIADYRRATAVVAAAVILLAAFGALLDACGGGGSSQTAPTSHDQEITVTVSGVLASQDWACYQLNDGYAGPITLSLSPENPIELSAGTCDSPLTTPIAHDDHGYIKNAMVSAGAKRVRMFNPVSGFPQYQLTIITLA